MNIKKVTNECEACQGAPSGICFECFSLAEMEPMEPLPISEGKEEKPDQV